MNLQLPKGFKTYFNELISLVSPSTRLSNLKKSLQQIYYFYVTNKIHSNLFKQIKQIPNDQWITQSSVVMFLVSQGKIFRHIFKTVQDFIECVNQEDKESFFKEKFQIFYSYSWLNDEKLITILNKRTKLEFTNQQEFFFKFKKDLNINQEQFADDLKKMISKYSNFKELDQDGKKLIIKNLQIRKKKQQKINDIMNIHGLTFREKVLKKIYKSQSELEDQKTLIFDFQKFLNQNIRVSHQSNNSSPPNSPKKILNQQTPNDQNTQDQIDQHFIVRYSDSNDREKLQLKNIFNLKFESRNKKLQEFLTKDHEKFNNEIKQLEKQISMVPQQFKTNQYQEMICNMKSKFEQLQINNKTHVQKLLNDRDLDNLLIEYESADKMNSQKMRENVLQAIFKYYQNQKNDLNKNDLNHLQKKIEIFAKQSLTLRRKISKIEKKNPQLKQWQLNYYRKILAIIFEIKNSIFSKLRNSKLSFSKLNEQPKTKLSQISIISSGNQSVIPPLIQIFKILQKYKQIFQIYYDSMIAELKQVIEKFRNQLAEELNQLQTSYLRQLKQEQLSTFNQSQLSQFQQKIRFVIFLKERSFNLNSLLKYINTDEKKTQELINQTNQFLKTLYETLNRTSNQPTQWNFKSQLISYLKVKQNITN